MAGAQTRLDRRRELELRRPCRRGASVGGRLPGRCAMERRRGRKELVRAGEVAPVVPADSGRDLAGPRSGADLRRPRLLNDPTSPASPLSPVSQLAPLTSPLAGEVAERSEA